MHLGPWQDTGFI